MKTKMFDVWKTAKKRLKKVIPENDFDTWIKPIRYQGYENQVLYLSVTNYFIQKCLEDHYLKLLTGSIYKASGQTVTVNFFIRTEIEPLLPNLKILSNFSIFNPKYTFDLFVSGTGNQFAINAAMAVASDSTEAFNPLYICAGTGQGKTHLLHAIGQAILANMPNKKMCYCSAESFMYEMVHHLRNKRMEAFRKYFRSVDVLLIDDIQFMSGKSGTQEEFSHTFDALYEGNKQIIVTSDRYPQEIDELDERLCSCFESGLIVDIQPPDLDTKIAILKNKSEIRKNLLPDDVANFLAASNTHNIRELEGMLIRINAYSSLQNVPITLEMAKKNLNGIVRTEASSNEIE